MGWEKCENSKPQPQASSAVMGGALSQAEKKQLLPHLQGFNPHTLSTIIWDTINLVGVDDQREMIGIQFNEPECNQKEDKEEKEKKEEGEEDGEKKPKEPSVTFWDSETVQNLPLPIFIDILAYVGEETIKEYEANYNLEEENEFTAGVKKLKHALEYLQGTMQSMERSETAREYRNRIDRRLNSDAHSKRNMIEEVRERHGTQMWLAGELEHHEGGGNKVKKGMEGMVDRLPELQKRYGTASSTTANVLKRATRRMSLMNRSSWFQQGTSTATNLPQPVLPTNYRRASISITPLPTLQAPKRLQQ